MDEDNSIGSIFDAIDSANNGSDFGNDSGVTEIEVTVPEEDNSSVSENNSNDSSAESPVFEKKSEEDFFVKNDFSLESKSEDNGQNPEDIGNENSFTTENHNEGEIKSFSEKIAAKEVMSGENDTSKPPVLNKNFILYVIVGVLAFVLIFAMVIFPAITAKREKEKNTKPVAQKSLETDYSLMATNTPNTPASPTKQDDVREEKPVERNEDGLPKVSMDNKYTYKEQPATVVSNGTVKERPDTSEDSLQSKSISGIKGLSSTQKNYLTSDVASGVTSTYATSLAEKKNRKNSNSRYDGLRTNGTSGSSTESSSNPYAKYGLPADKNAYTASLLQQYNNTNDSYARQNDQSGKNQFYQNDKGKISGQWLPLNSIWQGTIFEATLTSNICTDLPGECTAVITKNVYSSQDGSVLLIPQNSKLLGSYNSSISYSQSRVQVGWHTLIRPDGYEVSLGNMNATDEQGASGLKGLINDHPFQYLKAIALMSAFNIISQEFESSSLNTDNQYVQNILANSMEVTNTLGSKLIDRAMDVQPTITIKAGKKINIVANENLILPALEPYEVSSPYHKTR